MSSDNKNMTSGKILNFPKEIRYKTIIDTSSILANPEAIFEIINSDIIIPLTVIEELDAKKKLHNELGRAARFFIRTLDNIRRNNGVQLFEKIEINNNSTITIAINGLSQSLLSKHGLSLEKHDNKIISVALAFKENGDYVKLLSLDTNMLVKSSAVGIECEEFPIEQNVNFDNIHTIEVKKNDIDNFYQNKYIEYESNDINENDFVIIKNGKQSALSRYKNKNLYPLLKTNPWGLAPRSKEQSFALDLLMDQKIPLVAISGNAGTGKTITALASALQQVFEPGSSCYDRLIIIRPLYSVGGQEIGFLPGDISDKIGPWFESITDTLVALGNKISHSHASKTIDMWMAQGKLVFQPITYLRGRSLQESLIIVDESQNLEAPLTLKTILTRVGNNSKVVLLGDTSQIDNNYATKNNNALSFAISKFKGDPKFGYINLVKGERSEIADLAAKIL
jgi:PhoH-like ATPase